MNKFLRISIITFIVFFFFGYKAKAQDWTAFKNAVEGFDATINMSDYLDAANLLTWSQDLTVGGNHTFRGLIGNNFAILDGDNRYRAFRIVDKSIQFHDNFVFRKFYSGLGGGAISVGDNATVNFINSTANFIVNDASVGGAISVNSNSGVINFMNSVVDFTSNSVTGFGAGGAIFVRLGESKFTSSIVSFTSNTSDQHGGAVYADYNARIEFTKSALNFTGNRASERGGAIYLSGAWLTFEDSTAAFIDNNSSVGGGIFTENGVRISFIRSSAVFLRNSGGDIGLNSSRLIFEDSKVSALSGISAANNSNISLNQSFLILSGLNSFDSLESFSLHRSSISIIDANFTYLNSQSLTLSHSTVVFSGSFSAIEFSANVAWDIILNRSALILEADFMDFSYGLRVSNTGELFKRGGGMLVFGIMDNTRIMNVFNIEAGTVSFQAEKSTVNVLNMSAGSLLDLRGNDKNDIFILGNLNLDKVILGFDFTGDLTDFLNVRGALNLTQSSIAINFINANPVYGSSRAFAKASAINFSAKRIFLLDVPDPRYRIRVGENMLWLRYMYPWDLFVDDYKISQEGETAILQEDIYAYDGAPAFGESDGGKNFSIDGQLFIVHSSGFKDLGFVLNNTSLTFMNITFTSFSATAGGGVLRIFNSTINFFGTMTWINNAASSGGAISSDGSWLNFKGSSFVFVGNNAKNGGGAVFLDGLGRIDFDAAYVLFENNLAGGLGGAIVLNSQKSSVSFRARDGDMVLEFKGNADGVGGNDIYLREMFSYLEFDVGAGRVMDLIEGIRVSGEGMAHKVGGGELIFRGDGTKMDGHVVFFLDAGTATFLGRVSSFNSIQMAAGSMINMRGGLSSSVVNLGLTLELRGYLGMDFDFSNRLADFLDAGALLKIDRSTLMPNMIGVAPVMMGSSLAFARGGTLLDHENLGLDASIDRHNFWIVREANTLYLMFIGGWNAYINAYRAGGQGGGVANLYRDIEPGDDGMPPLEFWNNAPQVGVTIDGMGRLINSKRMDDLGFAFDGSTIAFKDVRISSFVRADLRFIGGGAIYATGGSSISFMGRVDFTSNSARLGGAIVGIDSSLVFYGTSVFSGNRAISSGGAIDVRAGRLIFMAGSSVSFFDNKDAWDMGLWQNNDVNITSGILSNFGFVHIVGGIRGMESAVLNSGFLHLNGVSNFVQMSSFVVSGGTVSVRGGYLKYQSGLGMKIVEGGLFEIAQSTVFLTGNIGSNLGGGMNILSGGIRVSTSFVGFFDNEAALGAAVYLGSAGKFEVWGSSIIFESNIAESSGGAVFADGGRFVVGADGNPPVSLSGGRLLFVRNKSVFGGGAIFGRAAAEFTLSGSTISFDENRAGSGGAIYLDGSVFEYSG